MIQMMNQWIFFYVKFGAKSDSTNGKEYDNYQLQSLCNNFSPAFRKLLLFLLNFETYSFIRGVALTDQSLERIGRRIKDYLPDVVNLNLKFQRLLFLRIISLLNLFFSCGKFSSIGGEALGLHIGRNLPHIKYLSVAIIGQFYSLTWIII